MSTRIPPPLEDRIHLGSLAEFPFGLVLVSSTGRVLSCNARARRWFALSDGHKGVEIGQSLASLVAPLDRLAALVSRQGVPIEGRALFDCVDGDELFTISVTAVPLIRVDPFVGSHALILEDVSELVFAEAMLDEGGWSPVPAMVPFLPHDVVRAGMSRLEELVHQLLECLVTPTVVLRGTPMRVVWSNAAARLTIDCPLGREAFLDSASEAGRHVMVLDRRMGEVEVLTVPMAGIGCVALMEISLMLVNGGFRLARNVDLSPSVTE